jgi:HK97 family phage portal protein
LSIIRRLLAGPARADTVKPPTDDFWFTSLGLASAAGVRVSADTAMKLSAVWRCNQILCGAVAMLPLNVYQRRSDGGKDKATSHPLWDVLHRRPNRWQTSHEWRALMQHHLLMRGNGYSRIVPGPRGAVDQLVPLHPDAVTVEQTDTGDLRYRVRQRDGQTSVLLADEVLHLRALSNDGVTGMGVLDHARETLGIGLAQEQFAGRYFSQSAKPGLVLKHPGQLSDQALDHLKSSWMEAQGGVGNAHKPAILEEGLDLKELSVGLTAEQAQLIESREFTISDIARWFGIPPHMIGETTKETSWGTGIESMSIGFVIYTLLPWLSAWEQRIEQDLILAPNLYFVEFVVDGLLRGDAKSRAEAFQVMRQNGVISANEWRAMENLNPITDGSGDVYWRPANFVDASAPPVVPAATAPAPRGQREALVESYTISRNGVTAGAGGH